MTPSCLNQTLISNALVGTGANVSLLIDALSPLCPKPLPSIEVLANRITTVIIGYVCGFLPWGFIVLFDFISAKWRTVRATRRAGHLHLVCAVFPMVFVVAYAVIQGMSGDYKEMMTAVIAVVMTFYHIARTAWGLAQVREYVRWCEYTLQCIRASRPRFWHAVIPKETDDDGKDEESDDLDTALMVNEDIVDNEFAGRDVAVSFSWRKWAMEVSNPTLCTIRWAAAFHCSFGHKWKSRESKPLPFELSSHLRQSTLYVDDENLKMSPTSFEHLLDLILTNGSNCGAFGSSINANLVSHPKPFNTYTFEFDNIVSSYPVLKKNNQVNRHSACMEMVEYILASRILGPEKMQSISSYNAMLCKNYRCYSQVQQAFELLQDQIGIQEKVQCRNVHWFWRLILVPHWSAWPNAYVLQSSAQLDAQIADDIAKCLLRNEELLTAHSGETDEIGKWRNVFLSVDDDELDEYLLGVSLDSVRTLLAHWVLIHESAIPESFWRPRVPDDEIVFVPSDRFREPDDLEGHVIAECQHAVQQQIINRGIKTQDLSSSSAMIALFLLSYPAVHTEIHDGEQSTANTMDEKTEYIIQPIGAPQELSLLLMLHHSTSTATLKIVTERNNMEFHWEKWINTAVAIVKAHNETVKDRVSDGGKSFVVPFEHVKRVDLSRPMLTLRSADQIHELPNLPGELKVWTAWPMFDVRYCTFELDQWMNACGPLPKDANKSNDEFVRRKSMAMKTFTLIATWNRN